MTRLFSEEEQANRNGIYESPVVNADKSDSGKQLIVDTKNGGAWVFSSSSRIFLEGAISHHISFVDDLKDNTKIVIHCVERPRSFLYGETSHRWKATLTSDTEIQSMHSVYTREERT